MTHPITLKERISKQTFVLSCRVTIADLEELDSGKAVKVKIYGEMYTLKK